MKLIHVLLLSTALQSLVAFAEQDKQDMEMHGADMNMDQMMDSMQGGSPPPDARDPDAYADGLELGHLPGMNMADDEPYYRIITEEFEYFNGQDSNGVQFDGQAWFGGDYNKVWLEFEGGRENGNTTATRTEILWDHTITTYWSSQLGVRNDSNEGPGRDWLAFGVQGLAPYWFEVEAMGYVGENGRSAFRGEVSYDLLFTQRLILQPNFEINIYGKDDEDRGIGSGVSDIDLALRLRYEIRREFAPYIGLSYQREYGKTGDYSRAAGEDKDDVRVMVGLRLWY